MKTEKLIAGLIITSVGLVLIYLGYQKMQPDMIESGLNSFNEFSKKIGGEGIPNIYKKDKTSSIIILVIGVISTFVGLWYILKSGNKN